MWKLKTDMGHQHIRVRDWILSGLILMFCISNCNVVSRRPPEPYYGRLVGTFMQPEHALKGTVYAVDDSTLFVKGFTYDGTAPDAFFWVGNSPHPSPDGTIVPYPEEYSGREPPVLQAHNSSNIILRLPMGKRIRDIKWMSVWCRRFTVNFGEVSIPPGLDIPKPRVIHEFKRLAHGLRSSNISVLDAKTLYIPNLHYDGAGPDAYFLVGNGSEPNVMGIKVPNEMGSLDPLRGYQGEDIEIQLPGDLSVYDIEWLAVYCIQYRHNFGHVLIPKDLDVPPALGQTKLTTTTTPRPAITNCRELINDRLQVKWYIQEDHVHIELRGRIKENEYMAFGISGEQGRAQMVGADVVVAFYDTQARVFRAEDYYMSALAQCDGKQGVCPDERIGGKNDVIVVSGNRVNHVTTVKYKRLLQTNEPVNDYAIPVDRAVSVIAAIGLLNNEREANAHSHDHMSVNYDDIRIDFTSQNDHNCPSELERYQPDPNIKPWPERKILFENTITARIGPTGGKKGYTPLTGNPSWGLAWYLNDLLIPEVYVERGETYTFIVEGGRDPQKQARYHPFYITNSPFGGLGQTNIQHQIEEVYAGVEKRDGFMVETGVGHYCEWVHKTIDKSETIDTFEEYKKTLRLECEPGEPGYLNWTVTEDTPDLVYYQCYTHRHLGWKIHVKPKGTKAASTGFRTTWNSGVIFLVVTLSTRALLA